MTTRANFDYIPIDQNEYLNSILEIIRKGIESEQENINIHDNEDVKNQILMERFLILGTQNEKNWIGVSKEHVKKDSNRKEDFFFFLKDQNNTRIFFAEAKRLPKFRTLNIEEYVKSSQGQSGGIQRYKSGAHGDPGNMFDYGLIGYIENKSVNAWLDIINERISIEYPNDSILKPKEDLLNEFTSKHRYEGDFDGTFRMHHFWLDAMKKPSKT